jgi:hypothetical protein
MLHLDLQPETEARIAADAQRRGLSLEKYIEQAAACFMSEDEPSHAIDALAGIRQGQDELKQGLGRSACEFLNEMRVKYAIPG